MTTHIPLKATVNGSSVALGELQPGDTVDPDFLPAVAPAATKLAAPVNINGVPFDATTDITIPGAGFTYVDALATYADLPSDLAAGDKGKGWLITADGKLYVWSGSAFPADGSGAPFQGPAGADSTVPGPTGPVSTAVPKNVQSGTSYTATADDAGVEIQMTSASPNAVVIPANTISANSLLLVRQVGTGSTSITNGIGMEVIAGGPSLNAAQQGALMVVRIDSGTTSYVNGEVSTTAETPTITIATSLPDGTVGVAYSGTITGTNSGGATGAITYAVDALPGGLTLNASTGVVSGTPTTQQAFTSTFTVTNGTQTVYPQYTFAIAAGADTGISVTQALPDGVVGTAYTGSITATNINGATGAITFTADVLPAGLTLGTAVDNGDGSYTAPITGTPTTEATTVTTFTVTNGTQTVNPTHSFVVSAFVAVPTFVRASHNESATIPATLSVTLTGTPTAGNLLVAAYGGYQSHPPTAPTGFELVTSRSQSSTMMWLFTKIADGTETTVDFAASATTGAFGCAACVVEYSNAQPGNTSAVAPSFSSGVSTYTNSTSGDPIGPNSVPLNFFFLKLYDSLGITANDPWTGAWNAINATDSSLGYFTRSAPGSAVSITYTRGTTAAANIAIFISIWIDPA